MSLWGLNDQFDEIVHENFETSIICDVIATFRIIGGVIVLAGVHFTFQVSFLSTSLITNIISRLRETIFQDHLTVINGCLQQFSKSGILVFEVITLVLPLLDVFSMPDDDLEVGVQEENDVGFECFYIQMDRFWVGVFEGVLEEGRLDHDQGVGGVFSHEGLFVVMAFIWGEAEVLDEMASTEVIHELWVELELFEEFKGRDIVISVVGEARDKTDERTIYPFEYF